MTMRAMLLTVLLLPATLEAQVAPTLVRRGEAAPVTATPVMTPATEGTATLDLTSPRTDDMEAPVVRLSNATPTSVTLSWAPIVGASGYTIYRNDGGALTTPALPLTTTSFTHSANNDYRVTYSYRVVAQYPNGHTGPSQPISFTPPKPENAGYLGADLVGNLIHLEWTFEGWIPPHHWLVLGPGLGDGEIVRGSERTLDIDAKGLGLRGNLTYTIAAVHEPGPVTTPASEWPRASINYPVGTYRISIVGFSAEAATADDHPTKSDGRGDEIFLAAATQLYQQSTGKLMKTTVARSRIYGDVQGYPSRIQAGRMSPQGGIGSGDQVLTVSSPPGVPPDSAIPLKLWEGELYPDDVLILRPNVFEVDRDPQLDGGGYARWRREVGMSLDSRPRDQQEPLRWQITHELEIPAIAKDLNYSESGGVRTGFSIGAQSDDNKQLGADQVITFNAGKIERFFANRLGVEFKFRSYTADAWGNWLADGYYRVFLKLERVP